MKKHKTFEDITKNASVQNALRDLYDHPDKVELYPGVFCESDAKMGDEYVFLKSYFLPFWYHLLICKSGSRACSVCFQKTSHGSNRPLERVSLTPKSMSSPGPSDVDAALWAAIFSDAITLVRSDRFYTVVSAAYSLN